MYSLTASLPQHLYGRVRREFITNGTDTGIDNCIIHAVSVRPVQALTFSILSILLENGAQYRGVPIHAFIVGQDPTKTIPHSLDLHSHQVWGCFGTEFSIVNMSFCKGLSAEWVDSNDIKFTGRGLGWAIEFYDDGYSNTPQQDKSFNMLVSNEGYLAAMPNNRVRWWEDSFTNWQLPIKLKVNHKIYYAEQIGNNPEETAFVKE
jgi:hypothetical protein